MSQQRHSIVEATARIASSLPVDVVEQLASILETQQPVEIRSRIGDAVPHAKHRSLALEFLDEWRGKAPDVTASEVVVSLRTAAYVEQVRRKDQSVEIVWTGPHAEGIPYRHTEQAILQVLNSAQDRILLVSYAVYSIPNIREAIVRAAHRGVQISVIVETPSKLDVDNEYSTLRALGHEVAACSRLYYWPKENRAIAESGKCGILHVKCAVSDGKQLFLSSANLTEYAFTINMELGVLICGGRAPAHIEATFDRLIEGKFLRMVS